MAVRHGYGKIAGTDALVFAYDTGDTRNSYKGEPTVNQFTNPNFSNGTTGWTFGSWDGGRYTYTVETVTGPFGQPVTALKVVRTTSDTSYAHFHQGNGGKFTNGNTYTLSAYVKGAGTLGQYNQGGYSPITYSPGQFVTLTGEWQRISYTLTSQTDSLYPYWAAEGISQNVPMYFTLAQSEQKSHVTPFVNGTRSATQGLLDLTGNNTIDLSNVSFDSNAQKFFDGTNDYLVTQNLASYFNNTVVSQFITVYPVSAGQVLTELGQSTINTNWHDVNIDLNSSGQFLFSIWHGSLSNRVTSPAQVFNKWYHVGFTYDGSVLTGYINGVAVGTTSFTRQAPYNNGYGLYYALGANDTTNMSSTSYFEGIINTVHIYNRVLTADEVRNNYRHYKNRFNIS